jgi:superfamily II DNA/RNA helicase
MPLSPKPLKHTMPKSDEEVQRQVEEKLGVCPCLWQILVVCKILEQDDVITIAATGSGKCLTYWMPLLFVKHGIVVLVTPLKLLGQQFVDILAKNNISAVSITATHATNEQFKVCPFTLLDFQTH